MQSSVLKIGLLVTLLAGIAPATAQTSSYRLLTADSLFRARQFTQSLQHYEAMLENGEYTPAMLLRMAYINEGLDRPGKTLYYLSVYYQSTGDRAVLRKMEELATKYNLSGYTVTDADRLLSWYLESRDYISLTLAALCLLLLAVAFRIRFRTQRRPIGSFITLTIFLALLLVHLNVGDNLQRGIIAKANTFIMTGPSPGSDVVERVGEGHRLDVIGKKDVWLKVRWNGQTAYVKEGNVLAVGNSH
ncbi:MAG TPA: SH3 domain-containing protein [Cyclobacteriaceae bacterium]|nr:SH3 domain-containing protein [Cyclobacteriaceae bacterium]